MANQETEVTLGFNRYGKGDVRLLRVVKNTQRHEIHEVHAQILLEGDFEDAYLTGSNKSIIPTDTQKNSLYAFAKKYSMDDIEDWAINVAEDYLKRYVHVRAVSMEVEELPWERIVVDGKEHNHAFKKGSNGIRTVSMRLTKNGELTLTSGFKELQVLKTTQSGFEGYLRDEYTTLPETKDRVLSTKIKCTWNYNDTGKGWKGLPKNSSVTYTDLYNEALRTCLAIFAGSPTTGTYSPSVQQTIYDIGTSVIKKFSSINQVSFVLPNIHYFAVDFSAFKTNLTNNNEVFWTYGQGSHGHIEGVVQRKVAPKAKL